MLDFREIIAMLRGIYSGYMLFLVILIGVFLLRVDVIKLKKAKLERDALIAKILGYGYIIGGIVLFILIKLI